VPEADAVLTVLMDCIKAGSIDIATVCTFHLPSTLIKTVELLLEASRSRRSLRSTPARPQADTSGGETHGCRGWVPWRYHGTWSAGFARSTAALLRQFAYYYMLRRP
jgi:hypothetical protein